MKASPHQKLAWTVLMIAACVVPARQRHEWLLEMAGRIVSTSTGKWCRCSDGGGRLHVLYLGLSPMRFGSGERVSGLESVQHQFSRDPQDA